MTHEDLIKLTPGPEADRLAAEAMGNLQFDHLFDFSRSYDSAWRIVEFLRSKGFLVRVQEMPEGMPWIHNDKFEINQRSVCILYAMHDDGCRGMRRITAYGENSCMAIIRALLMWRALHQAD